MPMPVPVAARSKVYVCGRSPAEIVGSNPTGGMDVYCECCVLSGRGLCDELITRPEDAVCDLEKLHEGGGHGRRWVAAPQKKKLYQQMDM